MKPTISELKYNIIHVSFLIMNLIGFVWFCRHIRDIHYLIKFFSVQSFELAILYSIVSVIKSARESKVTQILYELSFTYNIITGLGYWIIVRAHVINHIPCKFVMLSQTNSLSVTTSLTQCLSWCWYWFTTSKNWNTSIGKISSISCI